MTRLTIREASEKFGLSRMQLYNLLDRNCIAGFRSTKRGQNATPSWIDVESLDKYVNMPGRPKKGGPIIVSDGKYVPIREAIKKTGYSKAHIYRLARQGSISAKRPDQGYGWLVCLNDLINFKNRRKS